MTHIRYPCRGRRTLYRSYPFSDKNKFWTDNRTDTSGVTYDRCAALGEINSARVWRILWIRFLRAPLSTRYIPFTLFKSTFLEIFVTGSRFISPGIFSSWSFSMIHRGPLRVAFNKLDGPSHASNLIPNHCYPRTYCKLHIYFNLCPAPYFWPPSTRRSLDKIAGAFFSPNIYTRSFRWAIFNGFVSRKQVSAATYCFVLNEKRSVK